jgi:hypothetical protein
MDFFGIGPAMKGAALIYFQASRRTGRTTSLLNSLKKGDRVCCARPAEAERLRRQCKQRGLDVEVVTLPPHHVDDVRRLGTSQGRTIFDHMWVEQFYMNAVERAQHDIDYLEQQLSGYGEPHRETRRCAEELARWQG